jgi:WD40 repeat protein
VPGGAVYNIGVTPNGDTIAVVLDSDFINLIDTRTLRVRGRIRALSGDEPPTGANFSPDGRTLAVTGANGSLRFWDSRTLTPVSPVLHVSPIVQFGSRFTPDGRFLITKGQDWVLRLWDVRRHVVVRSRHLTLFPQDLDIRPDGKVAAVPECARDIGSCSPTKGLPYGPRARGADRVEIVSLPSLKPVAEIPMSSPRWARFSRDGRRLIVGNHDGRAQLYDGRTFRPVGRPLLGHAGYILTADFSPDGRTVATSSSDGTVRLWDTATSREIGTPLPGQPDVQVGVAYILGGTHVAAVYDGGQGYVWDVRPSSWARYACAIAGRTLTREEWQQYLPDRPYTPACASR